MYLYSEKAVESVKNSIVNDLNKLSYKPKLLIILVGDNKASNIYVNRKILDCKEIGINTKLVRYSENISIDQLLIDIEKFNNDFTITAFILQLPLPDRLKKYTNILLEHISYKKDADGLHPYNLGLLSINNINIKPATPRGLIYLLESYNVNIYNKRITVIGYGHAAGRPLSILLSNYSVTLSICVESTVDISYYTKHADIIVTCVGKRNILKRNMVSKDSIIVNVGLSYENGKLYGDLNPTEFDDVYMITPIFNSIGPMTRIMLLRNTIDIALKNNDLKRII